jgi:hypothetical protein
MIFITEKDRAHSKYTWCLTFCLLPANNSRLEDDVNVVVVPEKCNMNRGCT